MFLGLCHRFLSQKRSWDRNAQWSTVRTSMIVGGYHKWATCTCRHKMEGRGGEGDFSWRLALANAVGGFKQPCAKSWRWRHIDFQFKCNVKRGTFAYCLTHLDSNNIIMTIAELLEKEWILTSLKGRGWFLGTALIVLFDPLDAKCYTLVCFCKICCTAGIHSVAVNNCTYVPMVQIIRAEPCKTLVQNDYFFS